MSHDIDQHTKRLAARMGGSFVPHKPPLSTQLEELAWAYKQVGLSLPGEPAWQIEQGRKTAAKNGLHNLLHNNLATIIQALKDKGL